MMMYDVVLGIQYVYAYVVIFLSLLILLLVVVGMRIANQ
jgi:hypothetical protein